MAKQNSQVIWKLPNTIFTNPFHIKSSNEAYFSKYVLNCIDTHPPVYQPHTADIFKPAVGDPKQWRHDRAVRMPTMGISATCFPDPCHLKGVLINSEKVCDSAHWWCSYLLFPTAGAISTWWGIQITTYPDIINENFVSHGAGMWPSNRHFGHVDPVNAFSLTAKHEIIKKNIIRLDFHSKLGFLVRGGLSLHHTTWPRLFASLAQWYMTFIFPFFLLC